MSESPKDDDLVHLRAMSRLAHDIRGATGVATNALDELSQALGPELATGNATLFRLARCGLARLVRIADRCAVLAELSDGPPKTAEADIGEIASAAMRDAAFAFGKRSVRVHAAEEHLNARCDGRWMKAAVSDASLLALTVARAEVRGRVYAPDGGDSVRVVVEADADAPELAAAWSRRAFQTHGNAADEHALAMRLVDAVARAHGGGAKITAAAGKTAIEIEIASTAGMEMRP
jgi:hypothetical protein